MTTSLLTRQDDSSQHDRCFHYNTLRGEVQLSRPLAESGQKVSTGNKGRYLQETSSLKLSSPSPGLMSSWLTPHRWPESTQVSFSGGNNSDKIITQRRKLLCNLLSCLFAAYDVMITIMSRDNDFLLLTNKERLKKWTGRGRRDERREVNNKKPGNESSSSPPLQWKQLGAPSVPLFYFFPLLVVLKETGFTQKNYAARIRLWNQWIQLQEKQKIEQ